MAAQQNRGFERETAAIPLRPGPAGVQGTELVPQTSFFLSTSGCCRLPNPSHRVHS